MFAQYYQLFNPYSYAILPATPCKANGLVTPVDHDVFDHMFAKFVQKI